MPAPGLSRQVITVPFSGGVDQKRDPKQIPPGSFRKLVNCVRTHDGRVEKRRGSSALPLTSGSVGNAQFPLTKGSKLATFGTELLLAGQNSQPAGGAAITSTRLFSWSPAMNEFVLRDNLPDLTVKRESPIAWTNNMSDPVVAYVQGYAVYAWWQGSFVYVSVVDDATKTTVINAQIAFDLTTIGAGHLAINTKIIYPGSGTKFAIFFGDQSNLQKIYGIIGDLATLPISAGRIGPFSLVTITSSAMGFAGSGTIYDACALGTGYVVATADQTGLGQAKYYRLDANLNVLAGPVTTIVCGSGLGGAGEDVHAIGVCAVAGEAIHVAAGTAGPLPAVTGHRLQYHANDPSTDASLGGQVVLDALGGTVTADFWSLFQAPALPASNPSIGICRIPPIFSAPSCAVVLGAYSANVKPVSPGSGVIRGRPMTLAYPVDSSVGVSGGVRHRTFNTRLLSKPAYVNGRVYALALNRDSQTAHIIDVLSNEDNGKPARPVATIAPRISRNTGFNEERSCSSLSEMIQATSSTDWLTVSPIVQSASVNGLQGVAAVRIDFASPLKWQGVEIGRSAQLTGGTPLSYDGVTACEVGFLAPPEIVELQADTAPGSLTLSQPYSYQVVATWVDAKGQTHRSQPSSPVSVTLGGGASGSAKFRVRYLNLTCRTDAMNQFTPKVKLEIFRTLASGTKFLLTEQPTAVDQDTTAGTWDPSNRIYNDPTLEYTAFISDTLADGAIAPNRAIYTDGNVLESVCPPSSKIEFTYKQRLVLLGCDDPKQVWLSQPVVDGEAIRFTDLNVFRVDDGGDLTGGTQLDQVMILFKVDRAFYVTGDGSSDTGQGADLSSPTKIATDKGCIDHRSIVVFPKGCAYQATTGIVLMDRGLNVDPGWGRPVQDLLATYPVITSALVDKDGGQVRWEALTAEGSTVGVTIIYDYVNEQWGWFEHFNNGDLGLAQLRGSLSAVVWNGTYTRLHASGQVYAEKPATAVDAYLDTPSLNAVPIWIAMVCEGADIALGNLVGAQRVWKVSVLGQYQSSHDLKVELVTDFGDTFEPARYFDSHFLSAIPTLPVEVVEVGLKKQRCEAVRVRVSDAFPSAADQGNGAGVALSAFIFDIGVRPRRHPQAITARGQ